MRHLFSPEGLFSIAHLATLPSVLMFDLDGTLAPLVPHFADAKVPVHTARQLMTLSRSWPVAIVTGRSVMDAKKRLGFTPDYLFGNHGAERSDQKASLKLRHRLNTSREFLHQHTAEFAARKVCLEDKGLSMALHYRQCHDPAATRAWLHEVIKSLPGCIVVKDGHMVINILQADAPDKGDALLATMQDCSAVSALVVGDDENDEAAFVKAPEHAVTVRIGSPSVSTCARFRLSGQHQLDMLLRILMLEKLV